MVEAKSILPLEHVERRILLIRGQKVILDADLADLYGVTTKRLNQQVNRNRLRFPEDFVFQLTSEEKNEVVANCDHLSKLKFSPVRPYAFTEHGTIMAASVLNTPRAIEVSIFVVRAFVKLREMVTTQRELEYRLSALEEELKERLGVHEVAIVDILQRMMDLIDPPKVSEPPDKTIGFEVKERPAKFGKAAKGGRNISQS